jgi:hypothetical protein
MSPANARAHERVTSLAEARIGADAHWQDCRLINISVGGARVRLTEPLEIRHPTLEIAGFGRFRTVVAWHTGDEIGVKFDHDPAEIAEVVVGLATYG